MPIWLANLENNLRDRPVTILHGNVRDLYIDDARCIYPDLTALLWRVARRLTRQLPLSELVFYDISGRERRHALEAASPGAATSTPAGDDDEDNDLLMDDAEPRAPQAAAAGKGVTPGPETVLAGWLRELSDPRASRMMVLYYLDKLIPYNSSYSEPDRVLLLWLEKILDGLAPSNRLILVALRDTMVPVELYTSAPKVSVQPIPMPDADDRRLFFRRQLEDFIQSGALGEDRLKTLAGFTDGLFLRDLDNLARTLRAEPDFTESHLRRLLNQYRFGDQKDYFGSLDIESIARVVEWFEDKEGVHGQTMAIERIGEALTIARAGLAGISSGAASKPKGVLFFAGPTGVGKTLVARKLAKFLFGNEQAFLRFDMSEFKEEHTVSKLIGSPPGYVGSEEGGMLTNGVRARPFSVVLFDEIEKAHTKILDIFLQLLDDGRLTDSRGQTAFFTETIIVFTSNIGARSHTPTGDDEQARHQAILADNALTPEDRATREREHFKGCVETFFRTEIARPELLNRFGNNIVAFNSIDNGDVQSRIFASHLNRIRGEVTELYAGKGHTILIAPELPAWMAQRHGANLARFGGRGIVNCIETEVILPLAAQLLYAESRGIIGQTFTLRPGADGRGVEVNEG